MIEQFRPKNINNKNSSSNNSLINNDKKEEPLTKNFINPVWLSMAECAKIGGISKKTIRRAVESQILKYKIVKDRYFIDFASLINFLHTTIKLKNKLNQTGIGQYIKKWRE